MLVVREAHSAFPIKDLGPFWAPDSTTITHLMARTSAHLIARRVSQVVLRISTGTRNDRQRVLDGAHC
jgi:hypothetical protein